MLSNVLEFLRSIIEGGFVGQAVIATIVWLSIAVLLIQQQPVDDRLFDAAFIVLGYFFHVAQVASQTRRAVRAEHRANLAENGSARNGE